MIHQLTHTDSIANRWMHELRDIEIQKDRLRFRKNIRRIGEMMAYEISKTFSYENERTTTPLGVKQIAIPQDRLIVATILRAGVPMYEGFMDVFDSAESSFIGSYRKSDGEGGFDINQGYITCPDLEGKTLIIVDPMLATGSSFVEAIRDLEPYGQPLRIILVSVIASRPGINRLQELYPEVDIWAMDIDEELNEKSYIIPGLGDAGDLAFGPKNQS